MVNNRNRAFIAVMQDPAITRRALMVSLVVGTALLVITQLNHILA
jgi:hypothetical protein